MSSFKLYSYYKLYTLFESRYIFFRDSFNDFQDSLVNVSMRFILFTSPYSMYLYYSHLHIPRTPSIVSLWATSSFPLLILQISIILVVLFVESSVEFESFLHCMCVFCNILMPHFITIASFEFFLHCYRDAIELISFSLALIS